jgi:hypothetical protein
MPGISESQTYLPSLSIIYEHKFELPGRAVIFDPHKIANGPAVIRARRSRRLRGPPEFEMSVLGKPDRVPTRLTFEAG